MIAKNKKAMVSLAIFAWGLLVVCLVLFTLSWFNSQKNKVGTQILLSDEVSKIYVKEELVNFNLQIILDRAVYGFRPEFGKDFFIKRMKEELADAKDLRGEYSIPELGQIESQITPENIYLDNNKLSFNLKVHLVEREEYSLIKVEYDYNKNFEKLFNQPIPIASP